MRHLFLFFMIMFLYHCQPSLNGTKKPKTVVSEVCNNDGYLGIHAKLVKSYLLGNPITMSKSDLISLLKSGTTIFYGDKPWDNTKDIQKNSSNFIGHFILDLDSNQNFDSNREIVSKPSSHVDVFLYENIEKSPNLPERKKHLQWKSLNPYYAWQFSCPKNNFCKLLEDHLSIDHLTNLCQNSSSLLVTQCKILCRKIKQN